MAADDPDFAHLAQQHEDDDDGPELDPSLEWVWKAWVTLGRADRPRYIVPKALPMGGMTFIVREGPIPWTAIDAYARRHRIYGVDFEYLERLLPAMDDEREKVLAEAAG